MVQKIMGSYGGIWDLISVGHALHEKGLQRQIGFGTLVVSSQEKRALLAPLINRE